MIPLVTRSLITLLLLPCLFTGSVVVQADNKEPSTAVVIRIRISSSAAYEHQTALKPATALHFLKDCQEERAESPTRLTDIFITITRNGKNREYRMEKSGSLWNEAESSRLVPTHEAMLRLQAYVNSLRRDHYGSIIPWSEMNALLPKKSIFTIVDMEKGLAFRVQRRAGSKHADVQPLTQADTKTMKQIFDDHWSWNRRSILIITDNKMKIAASMNGMPHGGDGIPDNGFSGHFCVHFSGSSTHRSVEPDLMHQLMVYTAAGKRENFLIDLSPDKLSEVFAAALSQRNTDLLIAVSEGVQADIVNIFLKEMANGTAYRIMSRPQISLQSREHDLTEEIAIPVCIKQKHQPERRTALRFVLTRESVLSPWIIRDVQVRSN